MKVWEIGPGIGALTALLVTHNIELTVFEIDHGFVSALRTLFPSCDSFSIVEGDVRKTWRVHAGYNSYARSHCRKSTLQLLRLVLLSILV